MSKDKKTAEVKAFTGQDLAKAVKERLVKFEAQLKELKAREEPMAKAVVIDSVGPKASTPGGALSHADRVAHYATLKEKAGQDPVSAFKASKHTFKPVAPGVSHYVYSDGSRIEHGPSGWKVGQGGVAKSEHMEPGIHEAQEVGVPSHSEPGHHEQVAMDLPQAAPASPVGSATGLSLTNDNCPTCGNLDQPGSCICLDGLLGKSKMEPQSQPVSVGTMALSEKSMAVDEKLCKLCKSALCKCSLAKAQDFINIDGEHKTIGVVGVLPGDKKSKVITASPGNGTAPKGSKAKEESTEGSVEESSMGKDEMPMEKEEFRGTKPRGLKAGDVVVSDAGHKTNVVHGESHPHGHYHVEDHGANVHAVYHMGKRHKSPKMIANRQGIDAAKSYIAQHAAKEQEAKKSEESMEKFAPPMAKPPSGAAPAATPKSIPKAPAAPAPVQPVAKAVVAPPAPVQGAVAAPMMKSPEAHGIVDGMKEKSKALAAHLFGKSEKFDLGNCLDCGKAEHAGKCKP